MSHPASNPLPSHVHPSPVCCPGCGDHFHAQPTNAAPHGLNCGHSLCGACVEAVSVLDAPKCVVCDVVITRNVLNSGLASYSECVYGALFGGSLLCGVGGNGVGVGSIVGDDHVGGTSHDAVRYVDVDGHRDKRAKGELLVVGDECDTKSSCGRDGSVVDGDASVVSMLECTMVRCKERIVSAGGERASLEGWKNRMVVECECSITSLEGRVSELKVKLDDVCRRRVCEAREVLSHRVKAFDAMLDELDVSVGQLVACVGMCESALRAVRVRDDGDGDGDGVLDSVSLSLSSARESCELMCGLLDRSYASNPVQPFVRVWSDLESLLSESALERCVSVQSALWVSSTNDDDDDDITLIPRMLFGDADVNWQYNKLTLRVRTDDRKPFPIELGDVKVVTKVYASALCDQTSHDDDDNGDDNGDNNDTSPNTISASCSSDDSISQRDCSPDFDVKWKLSRCSDDPGVFEIALLATPIANLEKYKSSECVMTVAFWALGTALPGNNVKRNCKFPGNYFRTALTRQYNQAKDSECQYQFEDCPCFAVTLDGKVVRLLKTNSNGYTFGYSLCVDAEILDENSFGTPQFNITFYNPVDMCFPDWLYNVLFVLEAGNRRIQVFQLKHDSASFIRFIGEEALKDAPVVCIAAKAGMIAVGKLKAGCDFAVTLFDYESGNVVREIEALTTVARDTIEQLACGIVALRFSNRGDTLYVLERVMDGSAKVSAHNVDGTVLWSIDLPRARDPRDIEVLNDSELAVLGNRRSGITFLRVPTGGEGATITKCVKFRAGLGITDPVALAVRHEDLLVLNHDGRGRVYSFS